MEPKNHKKIIDSIIAKAHNRNRNRGVSVPRWVRTAFLSAGIVVSAAACDPPRTDEENNQSNNNNNTSVNNINNVTNNTNNSTTNNVSLYGFFEDAGIDADLDGDVDSDPNLEYMAP